jgi:calcineurin-like phosphoesterase family protein
MWAGLNEVGPNDILIHGGDLALLSKPNVMTTAEKLPGKIKVLIEGNHDKRNKVRKWLGWFYVVRYKKILTLKKDKLSIAISHRPQDLESVEADIMVHGHIHNIGEPYRWEGSTLWVNMCVEQHNYKPIALDDIVKIYKKKYE